MLLLGVTMTIRIFSGVFWRFFAITAFFCSLQAIENFEIARSMFRALPSLQSIIMNDDDLYSLVTNDPRALKAFPSCLDKHLIDGNVLCQKALQVHVPLEDFSQLLSDAKDVLQKQHGFDRLSAPKTLNFYEKAILFDSNAVLHVIGDQHGSFHDTVNFLGSVFYSGKQHNISPFQESTFVLKPEYRHHHWIFCGDLTDGGIYGTETLALILSVFIQNPNNIHIVRGNHEDIEINQSYGFWKELELKYRKHEYKKSEYNLFDRFPLRTSLTSALSAFYDQLPVALWGIFSAETQNNPQGKGFSKEYNVFLFCHGGIERQDRNILDLCRNCVKNEQKIAYKNVEGVFRNTGDVGYLWNDINQDIKEKRTKHSGRGPNCFVLSQHDIAQYMHNEFGGSEFVFRHIFRAHQHRMTYEDLMPIFFQNNGICQLGDPENPMVTTLLVMPGTFAGIPLKSEYSYFPGVVQAVPAVLYQKEGLNNVHYEFVSLPNGHIPDKVFEAHNRILARLNTDVPMSVKQQKPQIILSRIFSGPRWY